MLHFLEMRIRIALSPQPTGMKSLFTDNEVNSTVGYPHDILSAVCGGDVNNVVACPWSHPKPYSIETLDSE